jgi:DNA-binding NarL/FixJ family response regulator
MAPPEEPPAAETARARAESFALTPRELDVLRLLADGMTNKEIGGQLSIAEDTVKKHVQNIIWKLRAADRTQAAIIAYRAGLLDPIEG